MPDFTPPAAVFDNEGLLCYCLQEKLLEILHDEGLSETHLMAETWTQLEGTASFNNIY